MLSNPTVLCAEVFSSLTQFYKHPDIPLIGGKTDQRFATVYVEKMYLKYIPD